jgi:CubicO group peptidase (beta-lactamase class C family)
MMTDQTSATETPALPAALASFVESERRRADVAGIALAAFDRDGIRFAGASGFADIAASGATPDTLFLAASVSELFTTALVLRDVEARTVALDDP